MIYKDCGNVGNALERGTALSIRPSVLAIGDETRSSHYLFDISKVIILVKV